jgi:hypothetical protein
MQAIVANEIRAVPAAAPPMAEGCEDEAAFLDYLLDDIWEMLAQGVRVRCAPAHTPTLATIRAGFPSVRTVVLREVDRQHAMLLIHTDRRSGKFAELAAEAACSVHVYDPGRQVQLRIEARATLHLDDEVADGRWARTQHMSRVVYGSELAPGTATDDPEAATADLDRIPDSERRRNFAVIALHVSAIEWLRLNPNGHRRARFELGAAPRSSWLAP